MRKILLLLLALILLSCGFKNSNESKEINVLFIGNSLTYYNDMPQKLQEMMNETNPNIKIDQITFPGFSLSAHLENVIVESSDNNTRTTTKAPGELTATEKKLAEKNWDIIILQTGGVAVLIPESLQYKEDPAIKKIKELVNNDNSRFIIFNTWTTKMEYPDKYCYRGMQISQSLDRMKEYCSPEINNSKEYLELINNSYKSIADNNSLEKTDHGNIFQKVFDKYPEINILEDEMHPSDFGVFLSASIFYEIITKNDASDLKYVGEIDSKTAELLKKTGKINYR
ncbi:DUF4886 domain-containing protein [Gillisia marina]|uniref:DUF4886 domain-containing protein n=1 Tax=Gillisia marina TaxID=1167637 RepID=UPI00029B4E95|nr:DUF4886 domain-containing protein [Gillisia marina]